MTILFNKRFVNEAGDDLIPGKIHTIRANYEYWARHDGKECSLRYWSGKPRRSKQVEFCRKAIHVQKVTLAHEGDIHGKKLSWPDFYVNGKSLATPPVLWYEALALNDGFWNEDSFMEWFEDYPDGDMAILHFTDFRY